MKWFSEWWGTEIMAETKEDEELLKQLLDSLPREATESYVKGQIEIDNKPDNQFTSLKGYTLRFDR